MRTFVLGLDGGGTQTRVRVEDVATGDGSEGLGGACNIAAVPVAEAVLSVRVAAQMALDALHARAADVRAVCAGVAGWSFGERRAQFQTELAGLFPQAIVRVEPDYAIALAGATGGRPGVIVIAGTGSAAYGENAQGRSHRAGAYGYLIDDAGSGYGVGRSALAAVLRSEDGTGDVTALVSKVSAALGLTAAEIVTGVYGGGVSRVAIASLARVVAEAAGEGDAVARAILMRAGGALARLAQAVTASVFLQATEAFPVALVGGLWNAGPGLADVFTRSLQRSAPLAVPGRPLQAPVRGAVVNARRMLLPVS